jgi:hypothetical protein
MNVRCTIPTFVARRRSCLFTYRDGESTPWRSTPSHARCGVETLVKSTSRVWRWWASHHLFMSSWARSNKEVKLVEQAHSKVKCLTLCSVIMYTDTVSNMVGAGHTSWVPYGPHWSGYVMADCIMMNVHTWAKLNSRWVNYRLWATQYLHTLECVHMSSLYLGKALAWHIMQYIAGQSWFVTGSLPFLGAHAWMHGKIAWCTHELWMHTVVTVHTYRGYTHELWVRIHSHKSSVGVAAPMPWDVIMQGTCTLFENMPGQHVSDWVH